MPGQKANDSTFKAEYIHYKYYVQVGGKSLGPCRMDELRRLSGFTLQTPMRRSLRDEWKPAFTVMNMKAYFSSANDVKAWAEAAARLEREKARRARRERLARNKPLFIVLAFLAIAAAGTLFFLQTTGRIDDQALLQKLAVNIPPSIRSKIPYLQNLEQPKLAAPTPEVPAETAPTSRHGTEKVLPPPSQTPGKHHKNPSAAR